MSLIGKKSPDNEFILNFGKLDAATCAVVKGHIDAHNDCIGKARENPDDPDILVLELTKYKNPSGNVQQQQE